ncbi:MAG: tRNA lysidine(34) synthetase TilS [Bacteroidetes bacterium]|nr:tRNA lysidine(34) synthetase TilS [Bacteroidota bacterium]
MLDEFRSFIAKEKLIKPPDRILLAVSGGIDSVAMCELFHQASLKFGIAHCNFLLRGDESDKDELFVRSLAEKYKVPYYFTRFETSTFAAGKEISIQMAARELRYTWFESIRKPEGYQWIATAHHLDDQVETFFLNLMRNSGLAGFHGIPVKQGNIIRPLMFARRKEISEFVKIHHLKFREDSSNKETKYLRNKLRNSVLPLLNESYPGFDKVINETVERIADVERVYREVIDERRNQIVTIEGKRTFLNISGILNLKPAHTYLFEFLYPYGFSFVVVKEIIQALDKAPGKVFFSRTHKLAKDRKYLMVEPLTDNQDPGESMVKITDDEASIADPLPLTFRKKRKDNEFVMDTSRGTATLDARKIKYPLVLRKWQYGDLFHPFGMDQKKKVSDFLIDEKIPLPDKENVWVLLSEEKIIWVVGHRIDNRFRATGKTKNILLITLDKEK